MRKRAISFVLCLCMVISLLPAPVLAANSHPFTDVKVTDWFNDSVQYVYDHGLMNGTSSTTFEPQRTTQRGMVVTILYRLEGSPTVTSACPFTDVPGGSNYEKAIIWAAANSIVNGYNSATFGPYDNITRQQMAAILYRYARMKGYRTSTSANLSEYTDAIQISDYARTAMAWANGEGLINGNNSRQLMPTGSATRAHAAAILMRFCENVVPGTTLKPTDPATPTPAPAETTSYTVTFDLNYSGAGTYQTLSVKSGDKVTEPANPTRSNYSFLGWYTAATGGAKFDFNTVISAITTLYARWSRNSSGGGGGGGSTTTYYTVTFNVNGGSAISSQTIASGRVATRPADPTREGYTFGGWYSNDGLSIPYDFSNAVTSNITIFAKWDADENPSIEYENGDVVYTPDITKTVLDEETSMIYYNNLLRVYTLRVLDSEEADSLADLVNGTVVGHMSGAINTIQILVEESDVPTLNSYVSTLMESEDVLYATIDYPSFAETTALVDNNPWSEDGTTIADKNQNTPDGNDWWAEAIGAYTSWEYFDDSNNGLSGVTVGVLDNGFDTGHEDLTGNISLLSGFTQNTAADHGTHVAGLIGASNNTRGIRGVFEKANLVCVDWTPTTNDSNDRNYVNLLDNGQYLEITKQMIEYAANRHEHIVINNSWGAPIISEFRYASNLSSEHPLLQWIVNKFVGTYDSYLAYREVYARRTALECIVMMLELEINGYSDFIIVQSAGNGYNNGEEGYDASRGGYYASITRENYNNLPDSTRQNLESLGYSYERFKGHVLIVGATEKDKNNGNYLATDFSNYGSTVDIFAPGRNIFSTLTRSDDAENPNDSNNGHIYGNLSGTSMSGPIVAGAVALIWSVNPHLTAAEVKSALTSNNSVNALGVGNDSGSTYPMLNIGRAVRSVARLSGTVYVAANDGLSSSGETINNAHIVLTSSDGGSTWTCDTDQYGNYSLNGIPIGTYKVEVTKDGYNSYSDNSFAFKPGESSEKNIILARSMAVSGDCTLTGRITIADTDTDMTNNFPLDGATISLVGSENQANLSTYTVSDGTYSFDNLAAGDYTITVSKDGYITVRERLTITSNDTNYYNATIEAISNEYNGIGSASGTIYDALDGHAVSGLTLNVREGMGTITGDVVTTITTNVSGMYSLDNLQAGNYTVEVVDNRNLSESAERYYTTSFNIKVLGNNSIPNQNGFVTNGLTADQLRIVLRWGSTPRDLDSHLVGPTELLDRFHTYYSNENYYGASGVMANLDLDDTTSYGPETTTIYEMSPGVYTFLVHDYSNRHSSTSDALARSSANVEVFLGNSPVAARTFSVPNNPGTVWAVFSYNSTTGVITPINQMSFQSNSGTVGSAYSVTGDVVLASVSMDSSKIPDVMTSETPTLKDYEISDNNNHL